MFSTRTTRAAGFAAVATAFSLAGPLHAADFNWIADGGDMTDAANWNPSTDAPPRNGATATIGGEGSAIQAIFNEDLYAGPDTAPGEIRVLANGTVFINGNTNINNEHNLVLDGGQLDAGGNGRYYGTTTLVGDATIGGTSFLRMHGLIQEADSESPSQLHITRWRTGMHHANNNYSGGTIVHSGAELTVGSAGALGFGDVEVFGGGHLYTTVTALRDANATITFRTGSSAVLVGSSDNIIAEHGVTLHGQAGATRITTNDIAFSGDLTLVRTGHQNDTASWRQDWNGVFSDGDSAGKLTVQASANGANLGFIMLNANNTFSGGLELVDARLWANSPGNLGTGDVTIHANVNALLRLLDDHAINENATLTMLQSAGVNGTVELGANVTVASLILGENVIAGGTYSAADFSDYFTGAGTITVVPEPASLMLMTAAGAMLLVRRRRSTTT